MNPTLARLYGTGMSKTASAGEIDLSQISAADYLEIMNGQEKVANEDELDLSQLSAQELLDLAASLDEDPIEKMASSGDLDYWDAAGRVMAHAYADEMNKVAGADLPEFIDVETLSAQDLVNLVESGEYELVKEAGVVEMLAGAKKAGKAYLQRARAGASALGARAMSGAKAERARAAAANLSNMMRKRPGNLGPSGMAALKTPGGRAQLKELAKGLGETGAVYGGGAAATLGALAAANKMRNSGSK